MRYEDIKTFFERCLDDPNHQNGMISEFTIRQRLMDEIVELRNYIEQADEKNDAELTVHQKELFKAQQEMFKNRNKW